MHKLLRVVFDEELCFKEHNAYMVAKGMAWMWQFKRLSRPCVGMLPAKMCQLYKAIALPKMLYGCDLTNAPVRKKLGQKKMAGAVGFAENLARVQREAAISIMGAKQNTAADVLDVHANLLSMALQINKANQRAAMRYTVLPKTYLIYKVVQRAKRYVKQHRAPMLELLNAFTVTPEEVETIKIVWKPDGWKRRFKVEVAESKEVLEVERSRHPERWKVYSDSSKKNGGMGAAAVLYRDGQRQGVLRYQLGRSGEHTVYEAELVTIILGPKLLR